MGGGGGGGERGGVFVWGGGGGGGGRYPNAHYVSFALSLLRIHVILIIVNL